MKKNPVLLALCIAAASLAACSKSGGGTSNLKPAVTPVGTNDGVAKTQTIGSAGGTIVSEDGEMEIVIPAGALAANTDITIQPITNNAPNGRRKAYRCTPDGQTFSKDITIRFHYTDDDAAHTQPEYMRVAFQNADGTWKVIDKVSNNEADKIISATVNHFTDFTSFDIMRIEPPALYLRKGAEGYYHVYAAGMSQDDLIAEISTADPVWKVNGTTGGNSTYGTIQKTNPGMAKYTAPPAEPATNPVEISVEINMNFTIDGQQFNKGILTAKAFIIGAQYRLDLEYVGTMRPGTGEEFRVEDNVRMAVNLAGSEGTVTGAINVQPTFAKTMNSTNGCSTTFLSTGTGPINLRDIDVLGVQRVSTTGDVYVYFNSDVGAVPARMQVACPSNTRIEDYLPWSTAGAVLTFKDNGQLQTIEMSQTSNPSIKLLVTPIQ